MYDDAQGTKAEWLVLGGGGRQPNDSTDRQLTTLFSIIRLTSAMLYDSFLTLTISKLYSVNWPPAILTARYSLLLSETAEWRPLRSSAWPEGSPPRGGLVGRQFSIALDVRNTRGLASPEGPIRFRKKPNRPLTHGWLMQQRRGDKWSPCLTYYCLQVIAYK